MLQCMSWQISEFHCQKIWGNSLPECFKKQNSWRSTRPWLPRIGFDIVNYFIQTLQTKGSWKRFVVQHDNLATTSQYIVNFFTVT